MTDRPPLHSRIRFDDGREAEVVEHTARGFRYKGEPSSFIPRMGMSFTGEGEIFTDTPEWLGGYRWFTMLKRRCSLSPMPSDIHTNHTAQLPYLNQPFELVRAEAEEAGFKVEHWDEHNTIHTMQVRPRDVLIITTRAGLVESINN